MVHVCFLIVTYRQVVIFAEGGGIMVAFIYTFQRPSWQNESLRFEVK